MQAQPKALNDKVLPAATGLPKSLGHWNGKNTIRGRALTTQILKSSESREKGLASSTFTVDRIENLMNLECSALSTTRSSAAKVLLDQASNCRWQSRSSFSRQTSEATCGPVHRYDKGRNMLYWVLWTDTWRQNEDWHLKFVSDRAERLKLTMMFFYLIHTRHRK